MTRSKKAPVALRALRQRLNRALKKDGKIIRGQRGRGTGEQNRRHFLVDLRRNAVVETGIGPRRIEELARQYGALREWEEVTR